MDFIDLYFGVHKSNECCLGKIFFLPYIPKKYFKNVCKSDTKLNPICPEKHDIN